MTKLRFAFAALVAVLLATACGVKGYKKGQIEIVVINGGEADVSGVRVEHGLDSYNYGTILPGERQANTFAIVDNAPMVLRYVTGDGVLKEAEYEVRAEPEHGGVVEMHITREGEARLSSRFFLY